MTFKEAINKASKELNVPVEVCNFAYRSMLKFIKEKISKLPLKEDLTDEQFDALKTNFNIPSVGKMYLTKDLYHRRKKRQQIIDRIKGENNGRRIQNQETETPV